MTDRVLSELEGPVKSDLIGDIRATDFSRTVRVHAVRSLNGRQANP